MSEVKPDLCSKGQETKDETQDSGYDELKGVLKNGERQQQQPLTLYGRPVLCAVDRNGESKLLPLYTTEADRFWLRQSAIFIQTGDYGMAYCFYKMDLRLLDAQGYGPNMKGYVYKLATTQSGEPRHSSDLRSIFKSSARVKSGSIEMKLIEKMFAERPSDKVLGENLWDGAQEEDKETGYIVLQLIPKRKERLLMKKKEMVEAMKSQGLLKRWKHVGLALLMKLVQASGAEIKFIKLDPPSNGQNRLQQDISEEFIEPGPRSHARVKVSDVEEPDERGKSNLLRTEAASGKRATSRKPGNRENNVASTTWQPSQSSPTAKVTISVPTQGINRKSLNDLPKTNEASSFSQKGQVKRTNSGLQISTNDDDSAKIQSCERSADCAAADQSSEKVRKLCEMVKPEKHPWYEKPFNCEQTEEEKMIAQDMELIRQLEKDVKKPCTLRSKSQPPTNQYPNHVPSPSVKNFPNPQFPAFTTQINSQAPLFKRPVSPYQTILSQPIQSQPQTIHYQPQFVQYQTQSGQYQPILAQYTVPSTNLYSSLYAPLGPALRQATSPLQQTSPLPPQPTSLSRQTVTPPPQTTSSSRQATPQPPPVALQPQQTSVRPQQTVPQPKVLYNQNIEGTPVDEPLTTERLETSKGKPSRSKTAPPPKTRRINTNNVKICPPGYRRVTTDEIGTLVERGKTIYFQKEMKETPEDAELLSMLEKSFHEEGREMRGAQPKPELNKKSELRTAMKQDTRKTFDEPTKLNFQSCNSEQKNLNQNVKDSMWFERENKRDVEYEKLVDMMAKSAQQEKISIKRDTQLPFGTTNPPKFPSFDTAQKRLEQDGKDFMMKLGSGFDQDFGNKHLIDTMTKSTKQEVNAALKNMGETQSGMNWNENVFTAYPHKQFLDWSDSMLENLPTVKVPTEEEEIEIMKTLPALDVMNDPWMPTSSNKRKQEDAGKSKELRGRANSPARGNGEQKRQLMIDISDKINQLVDFSDVSEPSISSCNKIQTSRVSPELMVDKFYEYLETRMKQDDITKKEKSLAREIRSLISTFRSQN